MIVIIPAWPKPLIRLKNQQRSKGPKQLHCVEKILGQDAYHTQCLPIHISCLMELKKTNQIFTLAHKLVERYPEGVVCALQIAWYAVGCYYLLINKRDSARRYLSKATSLDKVFGPAWLMYGHSFAVENEHDQAMSAYFKASLLMKGCHLPLLYIGLEYGLNNNPKLAEKFLSQALSLAPKDPFVLHELGVVSFHSGDYLAARRLFLQALDHVSATCPGYSQLPEKWEPLLNNLGHTERKLKNYEKALEYHKLSLVLSPLNPATLSAIGYVYTLQKQWSKAVDTFHKVCSTSQCGESAAHTLLQALGIQKDDAFSTTMLGHAIENLIAVDFPCTKD
ncbi:CDC16, partial [Cordylochernes scorpioides]